jgi:hypothetical protein
LSRDARSAIFHHRNAWKATMMDEAFKTHKETTFGWLLMAQQLVAALRARAARSAAECATKPMRYLAPR